MVGVYSVEAVQPELILHMYKLCQLGPLSSNILQHHQHMHNMNNKEDIKKNCKEGNNNLFIQLPYGLVWDAINVKTFCYFLGNLKINVASKKSKDANKKLNELLQHPTTPNSSNPNKQLPDDPKLPLSQVLIPALTISVSHRLPGHHHPQHHLVSAMLVFQQDRL